MKDNSSIRRFFLKVRAAAVRREPRVITRAFGTRHFFHAYDFGPDTIVFERAAWSAMNNHASVLVAEKRDLGCRSRGHLITVTSGTHAVAAMPLLKGAFWDLASVPPARRSQVMAEKILAANVVRGVVEISQRDVPCAKLVALDAWLTGTLGLSLADVVMVERNVETLEHYRRVGQEWRVKPLAWTEAEMRAAIDASRKRIGTSIVYFHSARGVHFLSWSGFAALAARAQTDYRAFAAGLRELVGTYDGGGLPFARQRKFHGHHEIEFFGIARGAASAGAFVDALERLQHDVASGRAQPAEVARRTTELAALYKSLLVHPDLADDRSKKFVETLYMNLTGEIYAVAGDGTARAFDDRRTALPGATFVAGKPVFHPGCDPRTATLLRGLAELVSKDEHVEYANVYELRAYDADAATGPLGAGDTREIEYKTDRRPLARSLVEKRLSMHAKGYGSYVLARIEAFKALGVELQRYRLLSRGVRRQACDYYVRTRVEGDPLWEIPAHFYRCAGAKEGVSCEDARVALELAFLMGDAAAQNFAMKKYDARRASALYGVGKEIYRFAWDPNLKRMMPAGVCTCSVRGTCGWPDSAATESNFRAAERFYAVAYARTLRAFAEAHSVCGLEQMADRFLAGFEHRLHALAWKYVLLKTEFEGFDPKLPSAYGFAGKWRFALASLAWQEQHLDDFARRFTRELAARKAARRP